MHNPRPLHRRSGVIKLFATFICSLVFTATSWAGDANTWECRFTDKPPVIDGKPDDVAWKQRRSLTIFAWRGLALQIKSRAQRPKRGLLWDHDFLYFFTEMQDVDIYADITQHQGQIWENDVFELFFKPANDKTAYYEFEVSPNNTTLELFFPSRGAGAYRRFKEVTHIKMETAVQVHGTINNFQDRDESWSVEGRIPIRDMQLADGPPKAGQSWKFSLCRFDYSTGLDKPEQTSCAPLTRPDFHRYEDFATLKFVGPQTANAEGRQVAPPRGASSSATWLMRNVAESSKNDRKAAVTSSENFASLSDFSINWSQRSRGADRCGSGRGAWRERVAALLE